MAESNVKPQSQKGSMNFLMPKCLILATKKRCPKTHVKRKILEPGKIPEYGYLNELAQNNKINWSEIILTQEQWNYTQQGLTGEGVAIVALAAAGTGSGISAAVTSSVTVGAIAGNALLHL